MFSPFSSLSSFFLSFISRNISTRSLSSTRSCTPLATSHTRILASPLPPPPVTKYSFLYLPPPTPPSCSIKNNLGEIPVSLSPLGLNKAICRPSCAPKAQTTSVPAMAQYRTSAEEAPPICKRMSTTAPSSASTPLPA